VEPLDLLTAIRDGGLPFSTLRVCAPSADEVRALAPGQIKKPDTLNYRTGRPEAHGLFDEDVFGAFVDVGPAAPAADAEVGPMRFGRIQLAVPIVHPMLLRRSPARVAARAGIAADELAAMALRHEAQPLDAIDQLAERCPELVLVELPVLPAELRPMRRIADARWATSETNDLYRRVINRSNRLARLAELSAPEIIIRNEARMLHEAVDALFENEDLPQPVTGPEKAPLASVHARFCTYGGWDAVVELDRRVAGDRAALSGPLPYRLRAAAAHLYALGLELRPVSLSAPASPGGAFPVPY